MASKYELITESVNITGNGHHEIRVFVEETRDDGTVIRGLPDVFGIDAVALKLKHNDDPVQWRAWVAGEMKDRYMRRAGVHSEIMKWKNKRFEIG